MKPHVSALIFANHFHFRLRLPAERRQFRSLWICERAEEESRSKASAERMVAISIRSRTLGAAVGANYRSEWPEATLERNRAIETFSSIYGQH